MNRDSDKSEAIASANKIVLALFVKAPVPGEVKTRLVPAISEIQACKLHKQLTLYAIQKVMDANLFSVELWVSGEDAFFDQIQEQYNIPVYLQRGKNLGERLMQCANTVLKRSEAVVFIGSDCPFMELSYWREVYRAMSDQNYDATIGPAGDGGYVLLGIKRGSFKDSIFEDVAWSSDKVFTQTVREFELLGLRYKVQEILSDIDRPEDLLKLEMITLPEA